MGAGHFAGGKGLAEQEDRQEVDLDRRQALFGADATASPAWRN
jgi:hypothetical protein